MLKLIHFSFALLGADHPISPREQGHKSFHLAQYTSPIDTDGAFSSQAWISSIPAILPESPSELPDSLCLPLSLEASFDL